MKHIVIFVKNTLKVLFRAILVIIVMMIFTPPAYFIWRSVQPMELSQFYGLTYYQFINQRRQAYDEYAQEYQARHPDERVDSKYCFIPELTVQVMGAFPMAGFYTLAGMYPELQQYVNPQDLQQGFLPGEVTWTSFLSTWWETYEKFVWGMVEHAPKAPVPYCRILLQ